MPMPTPTPNPSKKLESPFLSMIFSFGRSQIPVYSAIGIVDMDERKPRHMDAEGLWNYALTALGGRAHSTGEMREKLARRAERARDVETVLARLKDSKYLDDRQFAEGYATARLSNERFGKTRVLQDRKSTRLNSSHLGISY